MAIELTPNRFSPGVDSLMKIISQMWDQTTDPAMADLFTQLGSEKSAADREAAQAHVDLDKATAAPRPETNPIADMVVRSVGGMAGALQQSDHSQQAADKLIQDKQTFMLTQREENLKHLSDAYKRAADRAERLGDLEAEMKFREKHDKAQTERHELHDDLRTILAGEYGLERERIQAAGMSARASITAAAKLKDLDYLKDQVITLPTGQKYLNMTNVPPADKNAALNFASDQKIPVMNKENHDRMFQITQVSQDMDDMLKEVSSSLPRGATERVGLYPLRHLKSFFQVGRQGRQLASWGEWRTIAIKQLQALAGGLGSGLRILRTEIMLAVKNDIPTEDDTAQTASLKVERFKRFMQKAQDLLIDHDWRQNYNAAPAPETEGEVIDLDAAEKGK